MSREINISKISPSLASFSVTAAATLVDCRVGVNDKAVVRQSAIAGRGGLCSGGVLSRISRVDHRP